MDKRAKNSRLLAPKLWTFRFLTLGRGANMRHAALFLIGVLMAWITLSVDAQTLQAAAQTVAASDTAKHGENVLDACIHVGKITLVTIVVSFAVAFLMKLMAKLLHKRQAQA